MPRVCTEAKEQAPNPNTALNAELCLENHALLVVEGASAESYFPQQENRDEYDNAAEYYELYPHGSKSMLFPMDYPRVSSKNKVPRYVRQKLMQIAAELYGEKAA